MASKAAYVGIAAAAVISLAVFAAYSSTTEPEPAVSADATLAEESKILVLSSFYPIEQFVSNVGGDRIKSELVLPAGAEPHHWEPTIRDVQNMKAADVMVINGIGFETWVDSLEDVGFEGVLIDTSMGVDVMEAVEGAHGHGHHDDGHGDGDDKGHGMMEDKDDDHGDGDDKGHGMMEDKDDDDGHGDGDDKGHGMMEDKDDDGHDDAPFYDPHIWLSPILAQQQVQNIADGLSEADPKNADYYQENADRYAAELQQLDSDIRAGLESCSRAFVASHRAFEYFSTEYGLIQHVIVDSMSPDAEVAPRTLYNVIETARAQNIKVIFTDEAADPRTVQVVADEIGGQVMVLSPLEIAEPGTTYMSKMYDNLESLKAALCRDQ